MTYTLRRLEPYVRVGKYDATMNMLFYDPNFDLAMTYAEGLAKRFADGVSIELKRAGFGFDECIVSRTQEVLQTYWSEVVPPSDIRYSGIHGCDFRVELVRQFADDDRKDWLIDVRYRLDQLGPRLTMAESILVQYRVPAGVSAACLGECMAQMLLNLSPESLVKELAERLRRHMEVAARIGGAGSQ